MGGPFLGQLRLLLVIPGSGSQNLGDGPEVGAVGLDDRMASGFHDEAIREMGQMIDRADLIRIDGFAGLLLFLGDQVEEGGGCGVFFHRLVVVGRADPEQLGLAGRGRLLLLEEDRLVTLGSRRRRRMTVLGGSGRRTGRMLRAQPFLERVG